MYEVGDKVELLICSWRGEGKAAKQSEIWEGPFIVTGIYAAEDRPYRVSCEGQGYYFRECAPECVRPI